jgi:hypothetical protein
LGISSAGLRLNSGFLPAGGTKIKLLLEVDNVPFEVAGTVADYAGISDQPDTSFAVELNVDEGSSKWDLYLTLLDRAGEAITAEMPAITLDSA